MISVNSMKRPMIGGQPYDFEFKGLSTDTKPSTWGGNDVGVNSLFLELDTGDFYYLKQQGSESQGDLIYEGTINQSDWLVSSGEQYAYDAYSTDITASTIKVIWNGVSYICESRPYGSDGDIEFGAPFVNEQYDFSEYPFAINTYKDDLLISFHAGTNAEVNVEIYEYSYVDAIWAKIGEGGGDEPSGELLFEATLDNWLENEGVYSTTENVDRYFPNGITVEWDGTLYQCTYNEDFSSWGATPTEQGIDWSTYPFVFSVDEGSMEITIGSPTDETHTIKVYG